MTLAGAIVVAALRDRRRRSRRRPSASWARSQGVDGTHADGQDAATARCKVNVTDNVAVFGVVKATIADIKPGAFVGVGAMPQPDGSQKAIRVMIFAESQRGTGEGHRPWAQPGSTMTNATVDTTVSSVDGQVLMVKYKDGEKKIVIPPGSPSSNTWSATRASSSPAPTS